MSRRFISFVLATTLAITGFSALPAKAGSDDEIGALIGTLATIYLLHETAKRDKSAHGDTRYRLSTKTNHRRDNVHDGPYDPRHMLDRNRFHSHWHHHRDGTRHVHEHSPTKPHSHKRDRVHRDTHHNWRERDRGWRPEPRAYRRAPLPAQCIRVTTRKGREIQVFGARCLNRNYPAARRLPEVCKTKFRSVNGKRSGYVVQCMRKQGYRIAWH